MEIKDNKIIFGEKNKVIFNNWNDFYYCLGYLKNKDHGVRFDSEVYNDKDKKWGKEERIYLTQSNLIPDSLKKSISEGNTKNNVRLNCNEYIEYINDKFNSDNLEDLEKLVPIEYIEDLRGGYDL